MLFCASYAYVSLKWHMVLATTCMYVCKSRKVCTYLLATVERPMLYLRIIGARYFKTTSDVQYFVCTTHTTLLTPLYGCTCTHWYVDFCIHCPPVHYLFRFI